MVASRVLVAAWPDWPVVAAGHGSDQPAVVVAANTVIAATAAARAEGVTTGLRRREAQRRCPELVVTGTDPGRDARAWEPVVAAVETLTPGVEIIAPGRLCLPTRGPSRYFGGDAALAEKVRLLADEAVGQTGCRVGVADRLFTANLAAGVGSSARAPVTLIEAGGDRSWLSHLPVGVLGPAYRDLADLLGRLGITTLGGFAALPAEAVLGRFGAEGASAHRLARGLDPATVRPRQAPPDLACSAEFDPPEDRVDAAAFVAKALADELLSRLESTGLAATTMTIEAETEHGERLTRRWRHEGVLTSSALSERTRWQLDGWLSGSAGPGGAAPTGGLTLLRVSPDEVRPDTGRQLGFWGGVGEAEARAARAMARVQAMIGPEEVLTAVLTGGRGFDDQVRLVPWGDARDEPADPGSGRAGSEPPPPWPGRLAGPAPAVVHTPPPAVEVRDSSGSAVRVNGRGLISAAPAWLGSEPVEGWAGPWPVEEKWWESGGRRRARLQILTAGGRGYALYLERGEWRLEGVYD